MQVKYFKSIIRLTSIEDGHEIGTWERFDELAKVFDVTETHLRHCARDHRPFKCMYNISHEFVEVPTIEESTTIQKPCKYCGTMLTAQYGTRGNATSVCDACLLENKRKRDAKRKELYRRDREEYKKVHEQLKEIDKPKPKKRGRPLNGSNPAIADMNGRARELHTTYGHIQQQETLALLGTWEERKKHG